MNSVKILSYKDFIFLLIIYIVTSKLNNNIFLSNDNIIANITSDNETEFRLAVEKLNKNEGGIIYIDTSIINIAKNSPIELSGILEGGIIGIKQKNGEYPRINFKKVRDNFVPNTISQGMITITGSNKFIKYLIIENSACYGINISGKKTTIDHVITRYNNFPGISLYNSEDTTLNYCYSYRNFGKNSFGKLGAGFAIDISTSKNVKFNYCFAWENSNNGWISFYNGNTDNSESLSFLHSAGWNNGNIDIFTGKYDYDNGKILDKNLWSIEELINSDENFENNYKNKNFNIENGKINGENAIDWITKSNGYINGYGFELGVKKISDTRIARIVVDYVVSFDNKSKGFINKNHKKCLAYFTNSVSFNNNINYDIEFNFGKWDNNWSWGEKNKAQSELTFKKPNNDNSAQKIFYSVRDQIIKTISSNTFNDNFNFDIAIKNLNE